MTYGSEDALVNDFVAKLLRPHQELLPAHAITREFPHRQGRTDLIAVSADGEVVAFEMKLTKWRDALGQAYRNTIFAHRSFVVLPWATAQRALCGEFERRGVGLCTILHGELIVLYEASASTPLQPWWCAEAYRRATRSKAS
jgi:hypothetical protein